MSKKNILKASALILISLCFIGTISGIALAKKQFVTIATGNSGGTFFALGGAMAEIFSSTGGVIANAQSTKGSVVNVALVNEGKADIAFCNSSIAYYGVNGIEMFEQKLPNVTALAELYPMHFQFVVSKNSNINSLYDMEGHHIAVGPKGSGTEANVRMFIEGWGMDYSKFKPSFISFSNAVDQLKNRALDGAFIGAGIPTAAVMDLLTTGNFKLVSFEQEEVEAISKRYPFFSYGKIPSNTYSNQAESVGAVMVGTSLIVNKNLSSELIYNLMASLYDNLEILGNTHSSGKNIKLENATQGMSIPIHSGSKKYLEEKGVSVPEN